MMRIFRFFIYLFAIAAFATTVLGYFGYIHPAFDSLGHFRIQASALTALFGLLIMLIGGFLGGAALLVTGVFVLWTTLMPLSGTASAAKALGDGPVYRLLQSNVRFDNRTPDEFIRLVARTKPDVISLQEIPLRWQQKLASVKHLYPYQFICPAIDRVGPSVIISRRPFAEGSVGQCLKDSNVAMQDIDFGGRVVTVASLHLHWPWPKQQPEELAAILPRLAQLKASSNAVILTGDLNAATWSHTASTIADATATNQWHYAGGTWLPLRLPSSWIHYIGLPIDNVFYNSRIELRSAARQVGIGSDHLPILIEFSIPAIDTASYPDQIAS